MGRASALAVALAVGANAAAASSSSSMLDDALTALGRGAYADAIPLFDTALRDSGLAPDVRLKGLIGRGEANLGAGHFDDAVTDCKQAADLDASSGAALNCLGLAYRGQKKLELAEDAFNRAVKAAPGDPAPLVNRGVLYDQRGLPNLAIADETQALQINASLPAALAERATAHFKLQQYDQTVEDDTRAIQNGLPTSKVLNDRGVAFAAMGKFDQAVEDLRQAQRLEPDNAAVAANLRQVEARNPQPPSAPPPSSDTPAPTSTSYPPPAVATAVAPVQPAPVATPPSLTFTRPVLDPVPEVTVPAKFCTEFDRNKFLTDVYGPAQATAKANGERATQYQIDLKKQLDARMSAPNDGSEDIHLIRAEMDAYAPTATEAYQVGQKLTDLYDAIRAVPAGGC